VISGLIWSTGKKANTFFELLKSGKIKVKEPVIFTIPEGRKAHEYLESGESSSKIILIPDK
jgi:NADPH2:quinone reductase